MTGTELSWAWDSVGMCAAEIGGGGAGTEEEEEFADKWDNNVGTEIAAGDCATV